MPFLPPNQQRQNTEGNTATYASIIVATCVCVCVAVAVKLESQLAAMRDCLKHLRRDYDKLRDERTEYQVS